MQAPVLQMPFMERRTMTQITTPDLIKFAKSRAKKLRTYLTAQGLMISHSQSLEATAQAEGFKDWNTYVARFDAAKAAFLAPAPKSDNNNYPLQVGDPISGTYRGCKFKGTLLGLEQTITKGVWRAKMQFDKPVRLPSAEALKLTRQRVRCLLNANGISVNLKGHPDGQTVINMP